jgi:hypothetical protein
MNKKIYHYFDSHFHKIIFNLNANKSNQQMSKSCKTLVICFDIYKKKVLKTNIKSIFILKSLQTY